MAQRGTVKEGRRSGGWGGVHLGLGRARPWAKVVTFVNPSYLTHKMGVIIITSYIGLLR